VSKNNTGSLPLRGILPVKKTSITSLLRILFNHRNGTATYNELNTEKQT